MSLTRTSPRRGGKWTAGAGLKGARRSAGPSDLLLEGLPGPPPSSCDAAGERRTLNFVGSGAHLERENPQHWGQMPAPQSSSARSAGFTLAAVCVAWGTIPALARWTQLPAAAIAFGRVTIAAVGLGAALGIDRQRRAGGMPPRPFTVLPGRCVAAAAVLAVHWAALFAAYRRAPAGTVILIVYLAPVGIAALAPRTLGERVGPRTVAALALGLAGVVLVAAPAADGTESSGVALAGLAAVTFVALILLSKPLSEIYGGLRLTFMEMAGAAVFLLPLAATAAWGALNGRWAWLVVLGLVHTALGTGIYLGALARVPATTASILGYLEPVSVVLFSWWLLSETPKLSMLGGGVLILAAAAVTLKGSPEGYGTPVGLGPPPAQR